MRDVLRDRQQWARHGMVTTGSPLATLAALEVLRDGGTAFDAAITASAVMTVALPMASGPAGDGAIVLWQAGAPEAVSLTALGRTPMRATSDGFAARGLSDVPETGILSVSTPALMDGWLALHRRHGSMELGRLLRPAIQLADDGLANTGQAVRWGRDNLEFLAQDHFQQLYAGYGAADAAGAVLRQPGLARLYRLLSDLADQPEEFRRILGRAVAEVSGELDGFITGEDCIADHARFAPAPAVRVGEHLVATTAAPTQGPLMLQNLALFQRMRGDVAVDSAEGIHLMAEIANQTYGWRLQAFGDPDFVPPRDFLAEDLLADMARGIDRNKLGTPLCLGHYKQGDTTQFTVIDAAGNGVSWVQSLGLGFGSGVGVPEFGMLLCNRLGRSATLQPGTPNRVEPGKRPVNTIMPWLSSDATGLRFAGGTPGGDGQTQWNAQVIIRMIIEGCSPLTALNRPRWTYYPGCDKAEVDMGLQLRVDADLPADLIEDLRGRGHDVVPKASIGGVMRVLERRPTGLYGLDDGRHEGLTAGW
ncbi:gamma-glutamyltransferase family protein [Krasilnikovia sp. MM14-A1004]|uniref:gamma-glutamyltransferase family protein n=1 Tax=Krasilnikovia sp. MM14-A1004 TaxID=3373541 RepID=UPI00399CBFFC